MIVEVDAPMVISLRCRRSKGKTLIPTAGPSTIASRGVKLRLRNLTPQGSLPC